MERPEFDPERDLQSGPYPRRGFTPELQQRIEERIERKARSRRLRLPFAAAAAAIAVCAVAALAQWPKGQPEHKQAQAAAPAAALTAPAERIAIGPASYHSGLLLGLRTDFQRKAGNSGPESADSSYRTLFIAPLDGRLDVAAEGKGILLPYGQTFWKIDAVSQSAGDDVYRTLIAHPANRPIPAQAIVPRSSVQVRHSERLLFAGNKYVTLEQTEAVQKGKRTLQTSRVWVKELQQVNGEMTMPADDAAARRYVGLQDLFGAGVNRADEWAIVRKPGTWVPAVASTTLDGDQESFVLNSIPLSLPDAVISHDQLCCTWADIQRIQPDAVDALSSPKKDFMAIVTPSSIYFNEVRNGQIGATPQLTINLNENEKLVMAQWATESYVDDWVKASRNYLKKP
ncbi:hypothetical protein [Gordoniibacillus kamchatkensis]|uniref:hypothetical protein n=1 Tax=Gordoniibacillus kamchatkensis TaxID=1590651 RepID=UPI000A6E4F7A|nr:hypothetical protein [Paenibacillus sp. VKM B-2647]